MYDLTAWSLLSSGGILCFNIVIAPTSLSVGGVGWQRDSHHKQNKLEVLISPPISLGRHNSLSDTLLPRSSSAFAPTAENAVWCWIACHVCLCVCAKAALPSDPPPPPAAARGVCRRRCTTKLFKYADEVHSHPHLLRDHLQLSGMTWYCLSYYFSRPLLSLSL